MSDEAEEKIKEEVISANGIEVKTYVTDSLNNDNEKLKWVFPPPQRTWMHNWIGRYPSVIWKRFRNNMTFSKDKQELGDPANHLPTDSLTQNIWFRPFIREIDDLLVESGLGQEFKTLQTQLDDLKKSNPGIVQKTSDHDSFLNEALTILTDFSKKNKKILPNLQLALLPILKQAELQVKVSEAIDAAKRQEVTFNEASILIDEAYSIYEEEVGFKVPEEYKLKIKEFALIRGGYGMFHIASPEARAMKSYVNDLYNICEKYRLNGSYKEQLSNELSEALPTRQDKRIQYCLTAETERVADLFKDARQRKIDRDYEIIKYKNWKQAVIKANTWGKSYARQNTEALVRGLSVGYYNPYRRTAKLEKQGRIDNAERSSIQIEVDPLEDSTNIEKLAKNTYKYGRPVEGYRGLIYLSRSVGAQDTDESGADKLVATAVDSISNQQLRPDKDFLDYPDGGEHFSHWQRIMDSHFTNVDHSPITFGPRWVNKFVKTLTKALREAGGFPGTNILATPYLFDAVFPIRRFVPKAVIAFFTGMTVLKSKARQNPGESHSKEEYTPSLRPIFLVRSKDMSEKMETSAKLLVNSVEHTVGFGFPGSKLLLKLDNSFNNSIISRLPTIVKAPMRIGTFGLASRWGFAAITATVMAAAASEGVEEVSHALKGPDITNLPVMAMEETFHFVNNHNPVRYTAASVEEFAIANEWSPYISKSAHWVRYAGLDKTDDLIERAGDMFGDDSHDGYRKMGLFEFGTQTNPDASGNDSTSDNTSGTSGTTEESLEESSSMSADGGKADPRLQKKNTQEGSASPQEQGNGGESSENQSNFNGNAQPENSIPKGDITDEELEKFLNKDRGLKSLDLQ